MNEKKQDSSKENLEKSIGKEILSIVKIFLVCFVCVFLLTQFVVKPIRIEGESMYPTLEDQQLGLTNVFGAKFQDLKRFDVVIVKIEDRDEYWVKRIIGMPHDQISIHDDHIYINGKAIQEPYLNQKYVASMQRQVGKFTEDYKTIHLGKDEYFLMGDNRPRSIDSRVYGPFKRDQIIGRSITIIYPLDQMKIVKNNH